MRKAWKIKTAMGIPLDFADAGSARDWLSGQGTLDGVTASEDNGASWLPLDAFPEFLNIETSGLRSRPMGSTRPPGRPTFTGIDASLALEAATNGEGTGLDGPPGLEGESVASDSHAATDASASRAATDAVPPNRDTGKHKPKKKKDQGAGGRRGKANAFDQEKDREKKRIRILLGVFAVFALGYVGYLNLPEAETGPQIPNTPAGQGFAWVFDQINGGTADLTEAELREHVAGYTIDALTVDAFMDNLRYHDDRRPYYTIVDFGQTGEYLIEVVITTETLERGLVTVEVENTEPYLITTIDIRGSHL